MKRALIVVGILVVLVAGLAIALLSIDVNQFRPQIEAQLQKALNRPVSLGTMSLRLLPPALAVDNVTIGESPALRSQRPFVTARQIRVRAGIFALLRKQIQIESLALEQPAVELIKTSGAKWNFSDIGSRSTTAKESGGKTESVGLDSLQIDDGTVAVTDQTAGGTRSVYDHIDLSLSGYAPGKRFDVDATLRFPNGGKASLKGTGGPLPSTAFSGKATASNVALASLLRLAGSSKLDANAVISANATLSASGDATNIDGDLKATDVRFGTTKLPRPIEATYRIVDNSNQKTTQIPKLQVRSGDGVLNASLSVAPAGVSGTGTVEKLPVPVDGLTEPLLVQNASFRLEPGAARIDGLRASLGKTNLTGNASVRNFSAPNLQFAANIDQVDYAEIEKLTAGGSQAKGGSSGRPSNLTGSGTVQIGTLRYQNLVLNDTKANCTLDRGLIKLAPLSANTSGGHVTGDITYDGRREPAHVAVNTKLDHLEANQLLSATTSLKDRITGLLSGDTQVAFASGPGQDITRSLNGTVKVLLTDGKLQGVNMLNELASVGKFLGMVKQAQSFTPIAKLAGTIGIQNGLARTDDLVLDLDGGSVAGTGTVNLVDQAINMKVTAVLSREMAQKAGGSQVGGLMSTVLANQKGELVIPAIVTGTLASPRFAPDAERFAQMRLKNLLPSTANPAAGLAQGGVQGLLNQLGGKKPAATPGAPPASPPQGAAGAILDLFKKKPAPQPPPRK